MFCLLQCWNIMQASTWDFAVCHSSRGAAELGCDSLQRLAYVHLNTTSCTAAKRLAQARPERMLRLGAYLENRFLLGWLRR